MKTYRFLSVFFFVTLLFLSPLKVNAEAIWNTTGEVGVTGEEYSYKYWTGTSWMYCYNTPKPKLIDLTYEVTYCYEEAYKMNALVNEQRRLAGVSEVQMKDELMDVAMKRAAQTALYWEHTLPNGLELRTESMFINGENLIVGPDLAIGANRGLVNSPGHYTQMINKNHAYAGYGCVKVNGDTYWVQIFSNANKYYEDGYKDNPVVWDQLPVGTRKDYTADFTISIKPEYVALKANNSVILEEGDTHKVTAGVSYTNKKGSWTTFVPLKANQYTVKVLTPNLCTYENGVMTALKEGTAQLQITLNADTSKTVTLSMKIEGKPVENGSTFSIGTTDYKITSTDSKTVEYRVGNTSSSTITIPNTVTIKGKSYKVTSISSNAFKNNTNLTNVTIGKNVKKIGKNAFYGCKNLKKITVKSTKISSVGSNAFKNIHKKAVIKVPKSKLSKYKKLFKNKGQKKSVKITK